MINIQENRSYYRILFLVGITFLLSLGFLGRLIKLQVMDHYHYAQTVARLHGEVLQQNQLRGMIIDCHGQKLRKAANSWYLVLQSSDPLKTRSLLLKIKPLIGEKVLEAYLKQPATPYWAYPKPLTKQQLLGLSTLKLPPEVKIIANLDSNNNNSRLAWHLLGTVSDGAGISGLEYNYESYLADQKSLASINSIKDGRHQSFPGLGLRAQTDPNRTVIMLTIDYRIQKIAEAVLDESKITGAVVIMDVNSGAILAMVSRPLVNTENLAESLNDPGLPFINRAIAAYLPGSIFKLVVLSAALESGEIKVDDCFYDPGYYQLGDKKWYCSTAKEAGHGLLSLTKALAVSCNPVFIEIGMRLPPDLILSYADKYRARATL